MRSRWTACCIALLAIATVAGAGDTAVTRSTHTDTILIAKLLMDGDGQMNLASQCLEEHFRAGQENSTSELLHILSLTDFELKKVTVKDIKLDPTRIRFGFEFDKRQALKTVYWEADCPLAGYEDQQKQKQTTAAALID